MDGATLTIEKLAKSFDGRKVLVEIGLSARPGECVALVGPSGSGKSTLLRLVAGLDEADSGCIRINGDVASNPRVLLPPNRRRVGMVFQDLALWPHMTALDNVEFMVPSAIRGRKQRRDKAAELLNSVHLNGRAASVPHELSRGQQQRVALARALASDPALLLLDEPFSSLDQELRVQMIELVHDIHRARGVTMVYVTHTTDELPRLADHVLRLHDGVLAEMADGPLAKTDRA